MSANRSKQFTQALDAIHRRWGKEALRPLAGLASHVAYIPTGYSDLDDVIGGGIPCGHITELSGTPTCGMTSLALAIVAQAQLQGRAGVYIDLARSFDPGYATGCGIQLDGLLIARPTDPGDALDILQIVAGEGKAGLVVLDPAPSDEILLDRALRKLIPALRKSDSAALVLNPQANARALARQAALCLSFENLGWIETEQNNIRGWRARVTVTRDRRGQPERHSDLEILLDGPARKAVA